MCIAPLRILNRSHVQVAGLTKKYFDVPCGKCWQCQSARRDSYLVRNFYEYLQCVHNFGWCLFITLTYRNETLPHVGSVPCFCKFDVQKYMKRFRMALIRQLVKSYGIDYKSASALVSDNIKYFVSSENGDKFHRPHYHVLLYCKSSKISRWIGRKIAMSSWKLGYAVPSSENYGFVNSIEGIRYVTKYVGKSLVDDQYYNSLLDKYKDTDLFEKLKDNKPFLLSSKGLGMFAVDDSCPSQFKLTFNLFKDSRCIIQDTDGVAKSKPLPQYYKRKFCYDVKVERIEDKYHVSYQLNDFGLEVKHGTYSKRLEIFKRNLDVVLSKRIPYPDEFTKSCVTAFGNNLTIDYVKDYLNRVAYHPQFPEYALLYSQYSKFFDETELKGVYHYIDPDSLEFFRNHVNFFDQSIAVSFDNIDLYYDFWFKICDNIAYFERVHPNFKTCLLLLEMLLFHFNKYITIDQYKADKAAADFRSLKD